MEMTKILRLQFYCLIRRYLLFISATIIIAGLMFIPFDKTDDLSFRTNTTYIFFFVSLLFSFYIGNFQYNPIGKIYLQLQMKRNLFPYLVIFSNLLNGIILTALFLLIRYSFLFYQQETIIYLLSISIHFCVLQLASYSLGNCFSLFLRKYRLSFLIFIFAILVVAFMEGGIFEQILNYSLVLFKETKIWQPQIITIFIFTFLVLIINIANILKYCFTNIIKAY